MEIIAYPIVKLESYLERINSEIKESGFAELRALPEVKGLMLKRLIDRTGKYNTLICEGKDDSISFPFYNLFVSKRSEASN